VLDLKFNPLPEEPTVASRRIRHDEALAKTRLARYEDEYDKFLMAAGPQPSLDLLRLAPENERAASDNNRKEVRFFKESMEKHATAANTALGIFNSMTTKSVQNDLSHIIDNDGCHPRHKVFQLAAFFQTITPPNVAIGERIKEELAHISLATTYVDALRVANQIRDLQAELELVNPTATLSLSEMVSKLLSKIKDPKFQMLRYQIADWEEKRLSGGAVPMSLSSGSLLASASAGGGSLGLLSTGTSSSSSRASSASGHAVISSSGASTTGSTSTIVKFRPIIDLIQKFRLSESTVDVSHSINSVDVIINGGNMGSQPSSPYGPSGQFPQQQGQYVWVPQAPYVKPPGVNGSQSSRFEKNSLVHGFKYARGHDQNREGYRGKYARGDKSERNRFSDDRADKTSRGDKPYRGDKDSSQEDKTCRGDYVKKSVSEGGDKKRDRQSSSRDHQAASMTVASGGDEDDDEDESSSDQQESD
jgi:hypothetical protein